ncbi:MAG: phosphatase PAP2 family protein [Clostridia bacterium]|nr:phosphatase PAP2 family protein [Clostridia bacterium]
MKSKSKYILPIISFMLFIVLIILIKTIDVLPTGVGDTEIGLYHLNSAVKAFLGTNMVWYKLTEVTGLISIAAGGIFAVIGLVQLIKRKSVLKVDREILSLGGLYITLGIVYVFFEKVIINYRPLILAGDSAPEASFPSSHTVLAVVIAVSIIMIINKYVENLTARNIIKAACAILAVVTVIGRFLSGVHWFTDILGGIILSVCLLSLFRAFIKQ